MAAMSSASRVRVQVFPFRVSLRLSNARKCPPTCRQRNTVRLYAGLVGFPAILRKHRLVPKTFPFVVEHAEMVSAVILDPHVTHTVRGIV